MMDTIVDDPGFLLRCALTYNWDVLISFCGVLLEILTSSVADSHQEFHLQRVKAAIQQLLSRDQWGNTALHAACYNSSPIQVITSLLDCASAANPPLQLHLLQSRDESTPLIIACATGASIEILQLLLEPPQNGLISGGTMVDIPDVRGSTPLAELVHHYELQRKSPWHARTTLPLDQVRLGTNDDLSNANHTNPLLDSFWNKTELLIRSAWCATTTAVDEDAITDRNSPKADNDITKHFREASSWISIVHGAAFLADSCPPVVTKLIGRCFPAMVSFTNRHGLLPLHMAVTISRSQRRRRQYPQHIAYQRLEYRTLWIRLLLDLYPSGFSYNIPYTNRSVFCQAVASGLPWHIPNLTINVYEGWASFDNSDATTTTTSSSSSSSFEDTLEIADCLFARERREGPLAILWKQNPDILSQPDVVTGLFPFLLAATTAFQDTTVEDFHGYHEAIVVDTIYSLLRLHPQLMGDLIRIES